MKRSIRLRMMAKAKVLKAKETNQDKKDDLDVVDEISTKDSFSDETPEDKQPIDAQEEASEEIGDVNGGSGTPIDEVKEVVKEDTMKKEKEGKEIPLISGMIIETDPDTNEVVDSFLSIEDTVKAGFSISNLKGAINKGTKYKGHLWSIIE